MKYIKIILKKLFGRESNGGKITQRIFGIKFTRVRPLPYEMDIVTRAQELKIPFRANLGYDLNLANPVTFNEKINWMKLYYYDDEMTRIVDKYEFKNYIKEQLGEGFTVPLLGAWDNVEDVDFDSLPEKFVLKCNAQSDSKYIKIVKDKSTLDIDALRKEMRDWLNPVKTLKSSFCWAYNNVKLRIIAEEYIEQIDGQVFDYKFMCFHGKPRWVLACRDRGRNTVYENHDMNWNLIIPAYKSATRAVIEKPRNFAKMVEIAKKLSAKFPFVRVDFYEIEDRILLGEMTFYPNGGYNSYKPYWDKRFGSYITLPNVHNKLPFFELVRKNRERVVNIWGKQVLSVYRALSKKDLSITVDNLTENIRSINSELKECHRELKDSAAELQAVKAEFQAAKDEFQVTQAELKKTVAELQSAQSEVQTLKAKLQNTQKELEVLSGEFKKAQSVISKLRSDLSAIPRLQPSDMRMEERIAGLKQRFTREAGYPLDLRAPKTFNEKINWIKLFYRNDLMTRIVDKYEFKNYIREKLGDGYTVPLIGAWDNVDDIDFAKLPDQFVLKCNAQSDGKCIKVVKDKNLLDIQVLKKELQDWLIPEKTLKTSYCWAYNNVKLRIIAEDYVPELEETTSDYKFFCFKGEVKCFYNANNWSTNKKHDDRVLTYYDLNCNPLPLTYNGYKRQAGPLTTIRNLDKMIEFAQKLSSDFPFVRVDFYEVGDRIYVGEMTFYPGGGYGKYEPVEWDYKLGEWLDLSGIDKVY